MLKFDVAFLLRILGMKKGKSLLTRLGIMALMAAIIIGALVAGYKFVAYTNKDAEEKFIEVAKQVDDAAEDKLGIDVSPIVEVMEENGDEDEYFVYRDRSSRTYSGKRLYEKYGYIYNDTGEVLEVFAEDTELGLLMSFDIDRKYGVFVKDGKCYLVSADLEYLVISDDCDSANICYEGTYVCLETSTGIYLYNIETGEKRMVASEGGDACISPDGRTVFFEKSLSDIGLNYELYVAGIDRDTVLVDSNEGSCNARAVSNDGNTLFYNMDDDQSKSVLYCMHDGKKNRVMKEENDGYYYFDRDNRTVLLKYNRSAYHYNSEKDRLRKLVEEESVNSVDVFGSYCYYSDACSEDYFIDTDRLSDVIMLQTEKAIYCLEGTTPKTVKLSDYCKGPKTAMTTDGPVCFVLEGFGELVKYVYRNGVVERIVVNKLVLADEYILNNDLSKGWFCGRAYVDEKLGYFIAEFDTDIINYKFANYTYPDYSIIGAIDVENIENILWDSMFEKCYIVADRILYSVDLKDGTISPLRVSCAYKDYKRELTDPLEFYNSRDTYILINNELYKCLSR